MSEIPSFLLSCVSVVGYDVGPIKTDYPVSMAYCSSLPVNEF